MMRFCRTPRQIIVSFAIMVNVLSSIISASVWILFLQHRSPTGQPGVPLIPLVITIFIAVIMSALISKPAVKPFIDMIEATKCISNGDFSVRVAEEGEGEVLELLRSFNKMTAELEGTELMRNDFINNFSHEFKTPIVSILGFAKRLCNDNLTDERRRDYLDHIVTEAGRLAELSSNILLLNKYENQQFISDRRLYNLDEQLRQCVLLLEEQWESKGIEIDLNAEKLEYFGNSDMLDHVWINLVGNAIKFSYPNSIVRVNAKRCGDHIKVTVSDEGIGMSKDTKAHIFDKFFQGDTAHSSAGNGLGLSLVKRIITLCGGEISVSSSINEGSSFSVSLPCDK